MTDLNIKPDERTLGVELSEGNLLFHGRSIVNEPKSFFDPIEACRAAIIEPLSDEEETVAALMEVVKAKMSAD